MQLICKRNTKKLSIREGPRVKTQIYSHIWGGAYKRYENGVGEMIEGISDSSVSGKPREESVSRFQHYWEV